MISPALCAVYTVIVLSAKNLFEVLKHVDDAKPFTNLLTCLLTLGLIQNTKEGFQAERTLKALEDKNEQDRKSLNKYHLETTKMLQKIIQGFQRKNLSFTA